MSTENLKTTFGLDCEAADILWEVSSDNPLARKSIFAILNKALYYYSSLKDIKDVKVKRHLMILIHKELKHLTDNSYLKNVLTVIYRENLRKTYDI